MKLNRTYLLHSRVHVPHRHSLLNTPFSRAPTLQNSDLLNLAPAAGPAGEAAGSEYVCVLGGGGSEVTAANCPLRHGNQPGQHGKSNAERKRRIRTDDSEKFEFNVALCPQRPQKVSVRNGESRTSTSTFTQFLSSHGEAIRSMLLYVHRDCTDY